MWQADFEEFFDNVSMVGFFFFFSPCPVPIRSPSGNNGAPIDLWDQLSLTLNPGSLGGINSSLIHLLKILWDPFSLFWNLTQLKTGYLMVYPDLCLKICVSLEILVILARIGVFNIFYFHSRYTLCPFPHFLCLERAYLSRLHQRVLFPSGLCQEQVGD